MAKITYGPIVSAARGKAGDTVFTRTRGGNVARALSIQAGPVGLHKLLSAEHSDTTPATPPTRGDLITGQAVATLWKRLGKGTQYQILNGGATELIWDAVHLDQASAVTGLLPKTSGGTGTASPALVAGANITITGTWPAHTVALTSPLSDSISLGAGLAQALLFINGAKATYRALIFRSAGKDRWYFLCDSLAETGANAGSNFRIWAFDDSGDELPVPFFIRRSNGQVGINNTNPGKQLDVTGDVQTSEQLISTKAIGTAPLAVTSTTEVANLNADRVGGTEFTNAATAGLIAIGSGAGTAAWTTPDGARVYHDGVIACANTTTVTLHWDTVHYNNGTIWTAGDNTVLKANKAGIYLIALNLTWEANATGTRYQWIVNATTGLKIGRIETGPSSGGQCAIAFSSLYKLAASDKVSVQVYQDSGVSLNLLRSADNSPEFSMQWLGP